MDQSRRVSWKLGREEDLEEHLHPLVLLGYHYHLYELYHEVLHSCGMLKHI